MCVCVCVCVCVYVWSARVSCCFSVGCLLSHLASSSQYAFLCRADSRWWHNSAGKLSHLFGLVFRPWDTSNLLLPPHKHLHVQLAHPWRDRERLKTSYTNVMWNIWWFAHDTGSPVDRTWSTLAASPAVTTHFYIILHYHYSTIILHNHYILRRYRTNSPCTKDEIQLAGSVVHLTNFVYNRTRSSLVTSCPQKWLATLTILICSYTEVAQQMTNNGSKVKTTESLEINLQK